MADQGGGQRRCSQCFFWHNPGEACPSALLMPRYDPRPIRSHRRRPGRRWSDVVVVAVMVAVVISVGAAGWWTWTGR